MVCSPNVHVSSPLFRAPLPHTHSQGTSLPSLARLESDLLRAFRAPSFSTLLQPSRDATATSHPTAPTSLLSACARDPEFAAAVAGVQEGHTFRGAGSVTALGQLGLPPQADVLGLVGQVLRAQGPEVVSAVRRELWAGSQSGMGGGHTFHPEQLHQQQGDGGAAASAPGSSNLWFDHQLHQHQQPTGRAALAAVEAAVRACACRQYGVGCVEALGYGSTARLLRLCLALEKCEAPGSEKSEQGGAVESVTAPTGAALLGGVAAHGAAQLESEGVGCLPPAGAVSNALALSLAPSPAHHANGPMSDMRTAPASLAGGQAEGGWHTAAPSLMATSSAFSRGAFSTGASVRNTVGAEGDVSRDLARTVLAAAPPLADLWWVRV